jgi:hypothetical protein
MIPLLYRPTRRAAKKPPMTPHPDEDTHPSLYDTKQNSIEDGVADLRALPSFQSGLSRDGDVAPAAPRMRHDSVLARSDGSKRGGVC